VNQYIYLERRKKKEEDFIDKKQEDSRLFSKFNLVKVEKNPDCIIEDESEKELQEAEEFQELQEVNEKIINIKPQNIESNENKNTHNNNLNNSMPRNHNSFSRFRNIRNSLRKLDILQEEQVNQERNRPFVRNNFTPEDQVNQEMNRPFARNNFPDEEQENQEMNRPYIRNNLPLEDQSSQEMNRPYLRNSFQPEEQARTHQSFDEKVMNLKRIVMENEMHRENNLNNLDNLDNLENLENLDVSQYLRKQIGELISVEFLVGDRLISKEGFLIEVGSNYLLLNSSGSISMAIFDLHEIKFINILEDDQN